MVVWGMVFLCKLDKAPTSTEFFCDVIGTPIPSSKKNQGAPSNTALR